MPSNASDGAPFTLVLDVVVETALPAATDPASFRWLVRSALAAEKVVGAWEIAIALVDDDHLRSLHDRFMGIDTPTDVMTFPRDGHAGGDIVVSVDRATAQSAAYGHTAAQEIDFLVLHGVLHLCGWNDPTDAQRSRMLDRQRVLQRRFRDSQTAEASSTVG